MHSTIEKLYFNPLQNIFFVVQYNHGKHHTPNTRGHNHGLLNSHTIGGTARWRTGVKPDGERELNRPMRTTPSVGVAAKALLLPGPALEGVLVGGATPHTPQSSCLQKGRHRPTPPRRGYHPGVPSYSRWRVNDSLPSNDSSRSTRGRGTI
jgi:hypothetical protein